MNNDDELYNQLAFYTLAQSDPAFIHQLVVDAYAAQNTDENTKPIATVFALIGLYLHLEKGFTGRQVQRAHMQLAKWPNRWPKLPPPQERSEIRIEHVLATEPGPARDAMIGTLVVHRFGKPGMKIAAPLSLSRINILEPNERLGRNHPRPT